LFASCVYTVLLVAPANAQWTQWGGPNQDWKADAKGLASEWPEDGPKHLWEREIGEGYSSILVDDGRLPGGAPSTLAIPDGRGWRVVRQGRVAAADLPTIEC